MIERHEVAALMKSVAEVVRGFVSDVRISLTTRMDEIERSVKAIPAGPAGPPGEDGKSLKGDTGEPGKDADHELIRKLIEIEVTRAVGALPPPKDGPAGRDGTDALSVDTAAIVADVLARIPAPKDGEPGKNASIEQIKGFVLDEVARAVSELPKPKDGAPGKDAEPIHPDTIALMVVSEVARQVALIPKAKDGRDGEAGRDALQIDILPAIPEKSAARGTFAKHAGGLWRSVRNAEPGDLSAWECLVEGVSEIHFAQGSNVRTFLIECTLSGGTRSYLSVSMPVLIYREIFQEGTEYERGDVVTFGGSAWHCQESTKARPGDGSQDWRLMVKSVRGKDGIDGKPGADGKPGKDK